MNRIQVAKEQIAAYYTEQVCPRLGKTGYSMDHHSNIRLHVPHLVHTKIRMKNCSNTAKWSCERRIMQRFNTNQRHHENNEKSAKCLSPSKKQKITKA